MLDHGNLSIPNRTKNINRDLDRYKAEQAKIAKAKAKEQSANLKALRVKAKAALAENEAMLVIRHGKKFGKTKLLKFLRSKAHWEPDWLLDFIARAEEEERKSNQWERENL